MKDILEQYKYIKSVGVDCDDALAMIRNRVEIDHERTIESVTTTTAPLKEISYVSPKTGERVWGYYLSSWYEVDAFYTEIYYFIDQLPEEVIGDAIDQARTREKGKRGI